MSLVSQSLTTQLLVQQLVNRLTTEENYKLHITGPLWKEFTSDQYILLQRASEIDSGSMFWRHHVLCEGL